MILNAIILYDKYTKIFIRRYLCRLFLRGSGRFVKVLNFHKKLAKKLVQIKPAFFITKMTLQIFHQKPLLLYANYFDVSLDYIFGRTCNPQGKLFDCKPKFIEEAVNEDKNLRDSVEIYFDPKSSMSSRLKKLYYKFYQKKKVVKLMSLS